MSKKYDPVFDEPVIDLIHNILKDNMGMEPRELAELIFDVMHPEATAEDGSGLFIHQEGKPW